jgi:hypothetical protein
MNAIVGYTIRYIYANSKVSMEMTLRNFTHCNRDAVCLWKIRAEQISKTLLQIVFVDFVTCYSY